MQLLDSCTSVRGAKRGHFTASLPFEPKWIAWAYLCTQGKKKKIFGSFFFPLWLYLPKPVCVPWREIGNELFNETGDPSKTHTHTHTHACTHQPRPKSSREIENVSKPSQHLSKSHFLIKTDPISYFTWWCNSRSLWKLCNPQQHMWREVKGKIKWKYIFELVMRDNNIFQNGSLGEAVDLAGDKQCLVGVP